jgi:CO/xanthine dehydrogenase Mo-binding subunit
VTEAPERYIGGGVPRKEDPALVTGRANWTDNIRLPGMLHTTMLRSPFAHAKITSIDVSEARNQPGVVAVFTGDDLADEYDKNAQANPAAITGYSLSFEERGRDGAGVTDSADATHGQPLDEETRTY